MSECACRCHTSSGTHITCDVDGGHGVGCGPHNAPQTAAEHGADVAEAIRDSWRAVDALTRPKTVRLAYDDGQKSYTVRHAVPSLLDQLVEAMESGAEQGKTHGVPSSRPPTDMGALSLLVEIAQHVGDGCRQRKIKRRYDNAEDLRALQSSVNTEGNLARIEATTRLVRTWCGRIRATISNDPDRTWRMHGAACTVCSSTTVPVFEADGTETRQPAMIVHSDRGTIQRVACDFCGTVLTGTDLVALVRDTRTAVERARPA